MVFEPVPAICKMPGPPLNAASSAITSSPTTSERSTPKSRKTALNPLGHARHGGAGHARTRPPARPSLPPACKPPPAPRADSPPPPRAPTRSRLIEPFSANARTSIAFNNRGARARSAAVDSQNHVHCSLAPYCVNPLVHSPPSSRRVPASTFRLPSVFGGVRPSMCASHG